MTFADIGAFSWYLSVIPWMVPGFTIDEHRAQLLRLHERGTPLVIHATTLVAPRHEEEGEERSAVSLAGEILIVTGPPGAGKSTMARSLVEQFDLAVLLQGDWYFDRVVRGWIEPWKPSSHHQNGVVTRAMAASDHVVRGRRVRGRARRDHRPLVPRHVRARGR